jgi:hypothetical protein
MVVVGMNLLYPKFPVRRLPAMIGITVLGAVVAGPYGAVHDQISYAISPEYFTKLKFRQFSYANVGWPPRVFAAEVGFLATWWVGLLAGWFLARAGLAELTMSGPRTVVVKPFAIIATVAALSGFAGALLGVVMTRDGDLSGWREAQEILAIDDLRAFVIVAYLHGAGYIGALVGLVLAIVYVRKSLACRDHDTPDSRVSIENDGR